MKCFTATGTPSSEFFPAFLEDSGLYRMSCSNGHDTVTCLQQQKFEVLFDLGVYALLDGLREAVSSFSAALERTHEFFLRVQGKAAGVSEEEFSASWKRVHNQSERQLGAFIFAHTLIRKAAPSVLQEQDIGFRNAVIHKGKIPSHAEALAYGEKVLELILGVIGVLNEDFKGAVEAMTKEHVASLYREVAGRDVSTMSIGTLVSLTRSGKQPTLVEWQAMLQKQRGAFIGLRQ